MKLFLPVCLFLLSSNIVTGQDTDKDSAALFHQQFGVSASYSPDSFRSWGKMENTRLFFLEILYTHTSIELPVLSLRLSSELILSGWIHYPIDGTNGPRDSRFGIGFSPLIIDIPLRSGNHYPFITSSAGALITDLPFPNGDGTRLNFLLDAGVGYNFPISEMRELQVGYKLHHLSNGNTGVLNPGIDSHMFFFKWLFKI